MVSAREVLVPTNLSRAALPSTDLSVAHLLRMGLSEAERMSANLDGANARVAARAGRVDPSATAGHRLQLPLGELAAFYERRSNGKHQVDGISGLLHGHHQHPFWQPGPQLLLHGRSGIDEQPSPEGIVLEAPLHEPALHLLPTRCSAHGPPSPSAACRSGSLTHASSRLGIQKVRGPVSHAS